MLRVAFAQSAADQKISEPVRQQIMDIQRNVGFAVPDQPYSGWKLGKSATPELIKLFPKLEDARVRESVVIHLANDGSSLAVGTLEGWARSKDWKLTNMVIRAFGRLGWQGVAPLLRIYKTGTSGAKIACVDQLLARCAYRPFDRRIRSLLVELLENDDPYLRQRAVSGLYEISIFWHADRDPGIPIYPEILDRDALMKICLATLDEDELVRNFAKDKVTGFAKGSRRALSREDQYHAVLKTDEIKPMATDPDWVVRCCYLAVLATKVGTTRDHVAALADPQPEVRTVAYWILRKTVYVQMLPSIGAHTKDKRALVRKLAAELLGKTYSRKALPFLEPLLKDADSTVRQAASLAITRITGPSLK